MMSIAKDRLELLSADPKVIEVARERERNLQALGHWAACEREEGRNEGQVGVLLKQIRFRFGEVSQEAQARVQQANGAQIEQLTENILSASSLDELLSGL